MNIVMVLRDMWMPEHGVPAIILFSNGLQFTASVIQLFAEE